MRTIAKKRGRNRLKQECSVNMIGMSTALFRPLINKNKYLKKHTEATHMQVFKLVLNNGVSPRDSQDEKKFSQTL